MKLNLQFKPNRELDNFSFDFQMALYVRPRSISAKYFYDEKGSALFDQICDLPEYYPTRAELSILQQVAGEIAQLIGPQAELIEFGAGSMHKVRQLLRVMAAPSRYVAIDISGAHLASACKALKRDYPMLDVVPIVADYSKPLSLRPLKKFSTKRIGFFPGSTIGNFTPLEADAFLKMAANILNGGALILGVDLIKSPAILHAAYNDGQGVTARFNLNLLERANRELNANFRLDNFEHYAFYNAPMKRIEMHLMSCCQQRVRVLDEEFEFAEGETFHTENSYKFTLGDVQKMAQAAGFTPGPCWLDHEGLFCLHWLQAPPLIK